MSEAYSSSKSAGVDFSFHLIANISDSAAWLKYLTPFSFAEGAEVLISGKIELRYLKYYFVQNPPDLDEKGRMLDESRNTAKCFRCSRDG